jgi:hypothetical protein
MNLKVNPLYKRLMLLALVLGPIFWLVFSEDGQRRSDLVLLSLWEGTEAMDVALDKLHEGVVENELRRNFPDVPLSCEQQPSLFGDQTCSAPIASFNGAPARYAVVYFRDGKLSAVKLAYRRSYHDYVARDLHRRLGAPQTTADQVWNWPTPGGLVLMPTELPGQGDEPTVIWLSSQQVQGRMPGHQAGD